MTFFKDFKEHPLPEQPLMVSSINGLQFATSVKYIYNNNSNNSNNNSNSNLVIIIIIVIYIYLKKI